MNKHDSERLESILRRAGIEPAETREEADLIVLNTCSVREKAEQKLRSEVGRLAKAKRTRPSLTIVVAGCMAQQEGEAILKSMPAVDLVVGPDNIPELPQMLAEHDIGGLPQARTVFDVDAPQFLRAPASRGGSTAFVTTMKGCNERCTFCVVPYTRGPERYRPSDQIISEIASLVEHDVAEVTLLGQTVNSYRDPLGALDRAPHADPTDPDESEFAALARAIADQVPKLKRLRYTSPHPRHLTPSLMAAHRDLACMPKHVHLPVQSGSSRILKRMSRRHTREEYLDRIERLRKTVPGITVSTDIIVGFCGETDAEFEQTLSLMEEVRFTGVFAFKYSVRPNTPARKLPDDVPEAAKKERLSRLFEVSERLVAGHLATLCDTEISVLVEGPSKSNPNHLSGRSERNEIVHLADTGDLALEGKIVRATVREAFKHSLMAELSPEVRAAAARKPPPTLLGARSGQTSPHGGRSLPVLKP